MSSPAVERTAHQFQRLSTFVEKPSIVPSSITPTTPLHSSPAKISSPSVLDAFASDQVFSAFLSPSFDSARFSSQTLASGSAASRAEKLHEGVRLLEKQLRSEVLSRHPELLSQLSSLSHAESALSTLRSAVSSLQTSIRRVRSELADPHRQIQIKTTQLSNLHHTSELLQSLVRILRLSKKLRDLMSVSEGSERLDLSKAAQLHCEILNLCNENGLVGIDVVDAELGWVVGIGNKLRSEAMNVLEKGMEKLNQAEVGAGLQVFYNLGELRSTVDGLVSKYRSVGVKSVSVALDMKAISVSSGVGFGPGGIQRSGTPQIGGSSKAKEALWVRLGNCMDQIHSTVVAVWHLQRVLSKKRDPFTHVLLLDEVLKEGDPTLTDRIWEPIVKSFASQMKSAFSASSFVKEIFTMGFPKLISMIENLLERISNDTNVKGVLPALTSHGREQMVATVEIFQTAFLTLCLSRLSDMVNTVFPVSNRGSVPSKEQISKIVVRIKEEIESVHLDAHLTLLVLREIGKVLLLLAERAEYQISAGPEARQISGPATPAQLRNFALYHHLQEIHTQISSFVTALPPIASEVLSPSLGAIYGIACDSVSTLFQSMVDRLETCILQMHDQDFGARAAMDNNTSSYVEELQKNVLHFRAEFLSRLLPTNAALVTETICFRLVRRMASRILTFFIRHASLIRPLSESGKLRMARDMAEVELAVGQNMFPVEQLGAPYRALRAFRPLIFMETAGFEASAVLRDVPLSVALHHLYCRGPEELQTPMEKSKLTPLQYSLWLDSQTEVEVWRGVKATLDEYAARVREKGDKEFSPVYALMLRLGSALAENA